MILAAGLGTRLKPLTDTRPKALVEVGGVPMLERVIKTLKSQGFTYLVVNVHHFADQILEFLKLNNNFGVQIEVSDERDTLLDTGGGIVKALPLLFRDDNAPVLIHNVDIISNGDLREVIKNVEGGKDANLLVSDRDSTRKLIFDERMVLKGWHDLKNNQYRPEAYQKNAHDKELAFSGIYALSRESGEEMKEIYGESKFSVMDYFLHPNRKKEVTGREQKDLRLLDIGKPATLLQAQDILNYISK